MVRSEDIPFRGVAAVTGGTRGIGWSVADALLGLGYRVVVGGRTATSTEFQAGEEWDSNRFRAFDLDVRDADQCKAFIEVAIQEFGQLDVLVNNAGVAAFAPAQELTIEDWDLQIQTNLNGPFYCTKAAIPHLISSRGWVINVGSLASRHPMKNGTGYNASKYGLLGLSEALMLDLRHEGVRVTTIMPGSVDTGFFGREPGLEDWRLGPEDVAHAIVGLLEYPDRAHVSRIELRPSQPPRR